MSKVTRLKSLDHVLDGVVHEVNEAFYILKKAADLFYKTF